VLFREPVVQVIPSLDVNASGLPSLYPFDTLETATYVLVPLYAIPVIPPSTFVIEPLDQFLPFAEYFIRVFPSPPPAINLPSA